VLAGTAQRPHGQDEAPHLFGLLLVVPATKRALAGVGQGEAQGVQVLALVELAGA
jgi:hypothetical protein